MLSIYDKSEKDRHIDRQGNEGTVGSFTQHMIVTHNEELAEMADRRLVMRDGVI